MPFHPTRTSAIHALDEVQGQAADNNYAWREGCVPSLTNATGSVESETTAGTVLFDGELIDLPLTTHQHDAGDGTYPRWDALVVTDRAGTIEVVKGVPAEPATLPDGTVLRGESAFAPAPSDTISREMVPLALVWIPSGAQTNQDLTDTANGGVADPVIDRRYPQPGRAREQTRRATINSSGWYRIATNGPVTDGGTGGDRATAKFTIRENQSGLHSTTTFLASVMFNEDPTLTLLSSGSLAQPAAIEGIRLVSAPDNQPFAGSAVEVNVQLRGGTSVDDIKYSIFDNRSEAGWTPEAWISGSVPSGFKTTNISLGTDAPVFATATDGKAANFEVERDGTVKSKGRPATNYGGANIFRGANQAIPQNTTDLIEIGTVKIDKQNEFDPSQHGIVVSGGGVYEVQGQIHWGGDAPGQSLSTIIRQNNVDRAVGRAESVTGTVGTTVSTRTTMTTSPGDLIQLFGKHTFGGPFTVLGGPEITYLIARRVA